MSECQCRHWDPTKWIRLQLVMSSQQTKVIAGGTSGLGLMITNMLRLSSAKHVIVWGRIARTTKSFEVDDFGTSHASITFLRADVSCYSEASEAVHSTRSSMRCVGSILHAAGLQVHYIFALLTHSILCIIYNRSINGLLCGSAMWSSPSRLQSTLIALYITFHVTP